MVTIMIVYASKITEKGEDFGRTYTREKTMIKNLGLSEVILTPLFIRIRKRKQLDKGKDHMKTCKNGLT